jgi:lantibiotic biosynthesis protein
MAYRIGRSFVLRTPLLAFDELTRWSADRAAGRAYLRRLVADPVVREALWVASRSLVEGLARWEAEPDRPEHQATERALVRYVSRMAARATPYGLCAAVSPGVLAASTQLDAGDERRHVRIDHEALAALCDARAAADPAARMIPNTGLYRLGDQLRYAERDRDGDRLVAVEPSAALDLVIDRARDGATADQLCDVLCEALGVERDAAHGYVAQLRATQLLVPELVPRVTGAVLDELPSQLATTLARLDATPLGASPDAYPPTPVHVDLHRDRSVALGPAVARAVVRAAELLQRIGVPLTDDRELAQFRRAFVERYERREVSLVEVLDEEAGIGAGDGRLAIAGAPLIGDRAWDREEPVPAAWGPREAHLLQLVTRAERTGARAIELDEAELVALATGTPRPPAAMADVALAAASPEAADRGDLEVLVHRLSVGARWLGRFCHGSPAIAEIAGELIAAEHAARPDAVFAEIVHQPRGPASNLVTRPVLRPYEIVYHGASGAPADRRITIDDLLLSVVDDRLVVRSRRLDREVVPRLTTAHLVAGSLGMYRFLTRLADQDARAIAWSWGALEAAPFLPRLQHRGTVVCRARWRLDAAELAVLREASQGARHARSTNALDAVRARQAAAVATLRDHRRLPRWIVLGDDDHELAIDLDNPLMVDSFVHAVKDRPDASVFELFPPPAAMCGRFAHELQVPLTSPTAPAPVVVKARVDEAPRSFPPGSSWLFLKFYGGPLAVDRMARVAGAVARSAVGEGIADRWHFLRYPDPDWHLRLRLRGEPDALLQLLPRIGPLLDEAGIACRRWTTDTYERELERYGCARGIDLAEQVFHADSEAALDALEATDDPLELAWLALAGMDRLLGDLGVASPAARLAFVLEARDDLASDLGGIDSARGRWLADIYRRHRPAIAAALAADHEVFERRSRALSRCGTFERAVIRSFVHLHVNRMLCSGHRTQELVLYDLLRRHYSAARDR